MASAVSLRGFSAATYDNEGHQRIYNDTMGGVGGVGDVYLTRCSAVAFVCAGHLQRALASQGAVATAGEVPLTACWAQMDVSIRDAAGFDGGAAVVC